MGGAVFVWGYNLGMVSSQKTGGGGRLPARSGLDIGAFSSLFRSTDTSYKFLWMLSILDLMKSGAELSSADLGARMLKIAAPLIRRCRFRFGAKDRTVHFLEEQDASGGQVPDFILRELLNFAPYRLLTPFYAQAVKNLSVDAKHRYIRKLANDNFTGKSPPLYRLVGEHPRISAIELHPKWRDYLMENSAVVRGWVMWHWALFLQVRNPSRPNIAAQLGESAARPTLAAQREFWRRVILWRGKTTKCIYSGAELHGGNFVLDHYLPFNFVGHARLWNLLPASSSANSSKSDSLPHARYFRDFVAAQHSALIVCREKFPKGQARNNIFAEYQTDLGIEVDAEKLTRAQLEKAYQTLTTPLAEIARSCGFAADWEYSPF